MRVSISKMARLCDGDFLKYNDIRDLCITCTALSSRGSIDFSVVEGVADRIKKDCVTRHQMQLIEEFVVKVKYQAVVS